MESDRGQGAPPCISCGHEATQHAATGGTCVVAGCGCSCYWDRDGFDRVLDLGDAPDPADTREPF